MTIKDIIRLAAVGITVTIGLGSASAAGFKVETWGYALHVSDDNHVAQMLSSDSNAGGTLTSLSLNTGIVPSGEDDVSSGWATASASLDTGKIKLFGQSVGPWGLAIARGDLSDTLYFDLPDGVILAPVTLTMSLTGFFSDPSTPPGILDPRGTVSLGLPGDPQSIVNALLGDIFPGMLSSTRFVQEGVGYQISASLFATTGGDSFFDLTNTAALDLILPEGVTFRSDSGVFLTERVSNVPEPSAWLLLAGGLSLVRATRRRRSGR
ncbi:MAG: PEP-CTERM sorting domain-containing protein [Acidobacteria bacterium]|nr:PEP-CTERM sorting domain-containing protein [Acidobacteriota bacterium]MDA1234434.1 PEP-CTERM sorting domain-containing protein [Acidobacteriota bacterium]